MMKMSRLRRKEALAGYGFVLPALILLAVFGFIPLILAGYTSLYKFPLVNPARREYLGFANYLRIFQDETLRTAFINTVYYALWQIPMQTTLGLLLALLIQKPLRGMGFFRTGYYLPVVISFGVMPMPCGEQCAVQSGAWHIGIHSQSEHPEEAWLLIDYLTNKEGHQKWIETGGYMPARKSVYEEMDKLHDYPWNIFMEGLINYAVHRPANVAWPVFNAEMTNAAKNVAVGADPKEELDRVVETADEELANY